MKKELKKKKVLFERLSIEEKKTIQGGDTVNPDSSGCDVGPCSDCVTLRPC